jgi:hypothetical protein
LLKLASIFRNKLPSQLVNCHKNKAPESALDTARFAHYLDRMN